MKLNALPLLTIAVITGCTSVPSGGSSSAGQFVMAGPTNAIAPELSMRWQYGLALEFDPQSISEIRFSCDPIPGTTFTTKGPELRRMKSGLLFAEGPTLLVSEEATSWLFENSRTSATCKAAISRAGQPETVIAAPVNFSASSKAATLQELKAVHDFNTPAKR